MSLNFLKSVFKSSRDKIFSLYYKAKKEKPGKKESEYLKLILLTKPPLDYQLDKVIDNILNENQTIEELADYISDIIPGDLHWKIRQRNLKEYKDKLKERNEEFFQQFWS